MTVTSEDVLKRYHAEAAKLRTAIGTKAAHLSALKKKVDQLPTTADGLATEFDLSPDEAGKALERLTEMRRQIDAALRDISERICLLDRALRYYNSTDMRWNVRAAQIKALIGAAASDPATSGGKSPFELLSDIDMATRARTEKQEFHDAFVHGWGGVTAATARFVGSYTGATDLVTVSTGMDDKGKKVGTAKRVAAFLSLAGGALLSDAGTTWQLRNIVTDGASRAARNKAKSAARDAFKNRRGSGGDAPDGRSGPDIATSQTSTKPSGTIADIESMGIPVENFDKIQARCLEENAQVLVRPSGVETPDHLRAGATPKAMHHKSKTANDYDGLIGADPTMNGAAAGFQPKTDFFENTMRQAGMSDSDIASNLDVIKAGQVPDAPPGFADNGVWQGAVKRYQHRDGEWNGPIGDGLRKRVADGDSEIHNGIIHDRVDGEMRPVTGDHDLFETFFNGKAASAAEADQFWQGLGIDAGVMHGGHARFDPKLADYGPGGRFEVDTAGYSPDAAAAKIQSKFESDRKIYEVIIEKHTGDRLTDDVLGRMDGFETPARGQYPDGAYGDLRFKQDQELFDRWNFIHSDQHGPLPKRPPAEVLVLINPVGPPLIIRAGDVPGNFTGPLRPTDFERVSPDSNVWLPRSMLGLTTGGVHSQQDIDWDESVFDWFDLFDGASSAVEPVCIECEEVLVAAPRGFPWKPVAAVTAGIAMIGGVIAVGTGGGDSDSAPESTVLVAVPSPSVASTAPAATVPDPTVAASTVPDPTVAPSTVPDPTVPPSTVPAIPDPATMFGFANPCGEVGHSSPDGFDSPSFIRASGVVYGVDGPVSDGTVVTFFPQGTDIESVDMTVGPDGLVTGAIFPISSLGDYLVVVEIGGNETVIDEPFQVSVGVAEGPVGGCIPAGELPPEQLDQITNQWVGTVDAGGGGGGGGGIAGQIPDSFPAPEDDLGPYREFFTRFETAHRDGDADFLLSKLHPAVIARYGAEQCSSFVDSVLGTVSDMRVVSGRTEPWDFPLDGGSSDIAGSVTLVIEANWGGEVLSPDVHVAPVDGDFGWFADCGDAI